ncbi:MAG: hypothetical protein CVT60_01295 [Actinobacteria bacterium HGW-Actinobacteria-10]|nr:MAG: hypothetical protein CVT60_01295 [Actinobacteria bacterium HGW-Actinobacteria-10]
MNTPDYATLTREFKRLSNWVFPTLDAAIVVAATIIAYYARFEGTVPEFFEDWILVLTILSVAVYVPLFVILRLYRMVLRYIGVDALLRLSAAVTIGFAILMTLNMIPPLEQGMRPVPIGVLFIQAVLVFLGSSAMRMTMRVMLHLHAARAIDRKKVIVIGAGSAGPLLLREIQSHPDLMMAVVGFLDDDSSLHGRTINGVPVLGATAELARTVKETGAEEVILAMPSAPQETVRRILNAAAEANVHTRVMPQLVSARGSVSLHDLRAIDVEDLLGRDPTPIDVEQVRETLANKVVAVTGAAGSIGAELCRQIVRFGPKRLVLIETDESRLYELWLELGHIAPNVAVMVICDIRDASKLDEVFTSYRPDVVLHAAAYKHVPLMELFPAEAVKTNVLGTLQVIEACERHGVEKFVLISTDKAVEPVNVMGLTKSLAERVMLAAVRRGALNAVAVRFGNVLGSRGSVVPIFEDQLRHGGPITVTDPGVTRYFMTIPEASRLVLQAQAIGAPGDVFVLEMGEPVKIVDLARKMIALSGVPADVEFIGLRPGEKLHEELVTGSEQLVPSEREKILRVNRVDVPGSTFDTDIRELLNAAGEGDRDSLFAAIERLEPGFEQRECGPR